MKTREEVDKLKSDWVSDPVFDLVDIEGFEEYRDELAQYEIEMKIKWEVRALRRLIQGEMMAGNPVRRAFMMDRGLSRIDELIEKLVETLAF